jgi:hypothetical protein
MEILRMFAKILTFTLCTLLFSTSFSFANPDAIVIPNGDLRIKGAGSGLVFPDGSIYKAPTQVTLSDICAAIKNGGMTLPVFCPTTVIPPVVPGFATVFVTVNFVDSVVSSDVATWLDLTTGAAAQPCAAKSFPTVTPDNIVLNMTSTAYAQANSSTIPASALSISNVTLTFTPVNSTTPALPARFQTQIASASPSLIIVGSNSVSLQIVSDDMKAFLAPALQCSGALYTYRVSVALDAVEVNTNRSGTVSSGNGYLTVNISDFGDK